MRLLSRSAPCPGRIRSRASRRARQTLDRSRPSAPGSPPGARARRGSRRVRSHRRHRRCSRPGSPALRTRPSASRAASRSAAGCISELWNGADTGSSTPRFAPAAFAAAMARSTAALCPAITTCSGALKLTGFDDLRLAPPPRTPRARASSSRPRIGRHRARPRRHRLLHRLRTEAHQRHAHREGERAGGDERRVFAKTVARR